MNQENAKEIRLKYFLLFLGLFIIYFYKMRFSAHQDAMFCANHARLWLPDQAGSVAGMYNIFSLDGLFFMPLTFLYKTIVGSFTGIFLYYRMLYIFVQALVAVCTYLEFRHHVDKKIAAVLSVMVFVFYYCYYMFGYKAQLFWFGIAGLLCILHYRRDPKAIYAILSACFISYTVLSYCTAVLLAIPLMIYVFRKGSGKHVLLFILTGVLCALLTVIILLRYDSFQNILAVSFQKFSVTVRGRGLLNAVKNWVLIIALALGAFVPAFLFERKFKGKNRYLFLFAFAVLILAALIGAKPQSVSIYRFTYIFICIATWGLGASLSAQKRAEGGNPVEMDIIWLLNAYSLIMMLSISLATNQGVSVVAFGVLFALMAFVIILMSESGEDKWAGRMASLIVCLMIFIFVFFVSENNYYADGRGNIFTPRIKVTSEEPLKGMYLKEQQLNENRMLYEVLEKHTSKDDMLLLFDNPTYGYFTTEAAMAYDNNYRNDIDLMKKHFEMFPKCSPTVVIIKADSPFWEKVGYSEWLRSQFQVVDEMNGFCVLKP